METQVEPSKRHVPPMVPGELIGVPAGSVGADTAGVGEGAVGLEGCVAPQATSAHVRIRLPAAIGNAFMVHLSTRSPCRFTRLC